MRAGWKAGARMCANVQWDGWNVNFLLRKYYDFVKKEMLRDGKGGARCTSFSFLNKKRTDFSVQSE